MRNPKLNTEGYKDTTAYYGMRDVMKEESETDKRAYDLIKVLKYVIRAMGFELLERIQLRDTKSGKEYK